MKSKIQELLDSHKAEAARLSASKNDLRAQINIDSATGDILLAYGASMKKIEQEIQEHIRAIASLQLLLPLADA